jgi:hypothetical protein
VGCYLLAEDRIFGYEVSASVYAFHFLWFASSRCYSVFKELPAATGDAARLGIPALLEMITTCDTWRLPFHVALVGLGLVSIRNEHGCSSGSDSPFFRSLVLGQTVFRSCSSYFSPSGISAYWAQKKPRSIDVKQYKKLLHIYNLGLLVEV